jgi:hypothetical protein
MIIAVALFIVLAIMITASMAVVNRVYAKGGHLNGTLIGFASFLVLILAQLFLKNEILQSIATGLFLFGSILFFMVASKNYKLFMDGKSHGWLARRVQKVNELSKKPH